MATFTLVLDTRVKKKNDQYNLSIRVINGSEQIYLNISKMTMEQYNRIFIKKSMDTKSIEFRESCNNRLSKSERIFLDLKPFNTQKYRRLFFGAEDENFVSLLLSDLFDRFVENYTTIKPQTQKHFKYSKSVFETFSPSMSILDVTPVFIHRFVTERKESGVSQSAVDSTLRDLRRVVNYFTNEDSIIPTTYRYPFGKSGYSIQNFFPRKLVMTNSEIASVIELKEFDSKQEEYARDIWEMLYRCNGINFADLLRMRWDNIQGEYLIFFRKKTETTRKSNKKEIVVPLSPKLKELIDKIGVKNSPFILGKLKDGYSDSMFENKNHKWKKIVNQRLDEISKRLNLSIPLRIKNARDSYAMTLRRAGVSKDNIGDMLGHSNSIVTEHYLGSMNPETTFDINKHLL
nr:tyrosine-type recombinase/integrase [uncultured Flavobacterium sp.]